MHQTGGGRSVMGKGKEPKPSRADIRHWNKTKDKPLEAFCPACKVWYPQSSNAHAGH